MAIRVLGTIGVRASADEPWSRPPPQQRLVLAALLAPAGSSHSATSLVEVVWPDGRPTNAHRLLQALVSRLRTAIGQDDAGGGPIVSVEGGWRLDPDDSIDAHRFEAELAGARDLAARGRTTDALERLTAALDLWHGPAFGDLADEPIVMAEVTRLDEHHLEARRLALQLRMGQGEHRAVIGELRELLVDQPLREEVWGLLMEALYRSGRQAEALTTYRQLRGRLVDDLGIEPSPHLRDLHGRILRQELDLEAPVHVPVTTPSVRHPLPHATTTFVGREDEREELADLLRGGRLVTVAGPGGVGKTRLALAAAHDASARFSSGAAMVDLSADADSVARAVAAALGVAEVAHEPIGTTLRAHLRGRDVLLVVDNCERRLAEVGALAEDLVAVDGGMCIVATSRQRLGVPGERVLQVAPLSLEPGRDGGPSEAARLFLDRVDVHALAPDPAAVEEICRRLDGLPLAIELAAARAGSLGIEGLSAGLADRLQLLQSGTSGPSRHNSLRAVLDYSHDLLEPREQVVFRRMAVFAGSFDLDDAIAVVAGDDFPAADVVHDVGRLVDKNLLVRRLAAGASRWTMLDTIRAYATEALDAAGELAALQARHLAWAAATSTELAAGMDGAGPWRARFRLVEPDLQVALQRARSTMDAGTRVSLDDALGLAFDLTDLQARMGSYASAQEACELAIHLARSGDRPDDLARAAIGASETGMTFGVSDPTRVAWLEEALEATAGGASTARVQLMGRLGMELYWGSDRTRALEVVGQSVAEARELGDDATALAHALYAQHYVTRGPEDLATQVDLSRHVVEHATRAERNDLLLAGLSALTVDQLASGDIAAFQASLDALSEASNRLDRPAYRWYAEAFRAVHALLEGRWDDADAQTATVLAASRGVAEFTVGLDFAESITDLRDVDAPTRRQRISRLETLARRFPGVLVWRCLQLQHRLALLNPAPRGPASPPPPPIRPGATSQLRSEATALADRVLRSDRDAHWLVETSLLAELAVELDDPVLAERLEAAMRPLADRMAVAGRVGAFRGSVAHPLGLCRLVLGDPDGAVRDLARAREAHAAIGARPFEVRSIVWLAAAHAARGEDQEAADLCSEVAASG